MKCQWEWLPSLNPILWNIGILLYKQAKLPLHLQHSVGVFYNFLVFISKFRQVGCIYIWGNGGKCWSDHFTAIPASCCTYLVPSMQIYGLNHFYLPKRGKNLIKFRERTIDFYFILFTMGMGYFSWKVHSMYMYSKRLSCLYSKASLVTSCICI